MELRKRRACVIIRAVAPARVFFLFSIDSSFFFYTHARDAVQIDAWRDKAGMWISRLGRYFAGLRAGVLGGCRIIARPRERDMTLALWLRIVCCDGARGGIKRWRNIYTARARAGTKKKLPRVRLFNEPVIRIINAFDIDYYIPVIIRFWCFFLSGDRQPINANK